MNQNSTPSPATHEHTRVASHSSHLTADDGNEYPSPSTPEHNGSEIYDVFHTPRADNCDTYVDEIVTVNGQLTACFYDSALGVNAIIDESVVDPRDYTGQHVKLQGPFCYSPIHTLPTAVIDLKSAFYTGPVEVAVTQTSKTAMILGRPIVGKPVPTTVSPCQTSKTDRRSALHSTPTSGLPVSTKNRLRNLNIPRSKRELRRTLYEFKYYENRLIPNFRNLSAPLFDLLYLPGPPLMNWREDHSYAFRLLKWHLGQNPFARRGPRPSIPPSRLPVTVLRPDYRRASTAPGTPRAGIDLSNETSLMAG